MATKRSKRASKTSPARSGRRGKARAAAAEAKPKGVVNAWEQDPGDGAQPSGGQVIQRPVPVLREQPFSIRIVNPASAPEAKPHSPGTADFRYWTAAEALRRGADFWGALLPGTSWEVGSILPVDLDFGIDLNAFYDREGLKFFHGSAAGRTVFSGESPDVVCHELGHAILDSLKPQLFDAASIEVAAFHESFGDMSAILSALQLPSLREGVLAETGGVLHRASRLSRLAEQLGWAIRQSVPSAVEADCLRNAVNTFFYRYLGAVDGSGRDARASARRGRRGKHGIGDATKATAFGGRVWPRCPFHRGLCRGRAEAPRGCRRGACRRAGLRVGPGSGRQVLLRRSAATGATQGRESGQASGRSPTLLRAAHPRNPHPRIAARRTADGAAPSSHRLRGLAPLRTHARGLYDA
jgi:hypothetical protein